MFKTDYLASREYNPSRASKLSLLALALSTTLGLGSFTTGCQSDSNSTNTATGGQKLGGSKTSGGSTSSTGGIGANGGAVSTGGITTTGGLTATGGVTTGGTSTTGGSSPSGGSTATGGSMATGGANNLGGAESSGGQGGSVPIGGVISSEPAVSIITSGPAPQSGDLWVSPTGNDSGTGDKESPLKSLATAIGKSSPGKTIWVMTGTHAMSATINILTHGTEAQPIRVFGVPGAPRPVLDFSGVGSGRGIAHKGNYWHFRYLEMKNAGDNCMAITGNHNTIELIAVHDCGDTGMQISKINSKDTPPAFNKVINCDSYANADSSAEDADGFAAKLVIGEGNVFEGCRSWHNVDDCWDMYDARNVVTIKNCWAFGARHPTKSKSNSDGNGFKLGGQRREIGWYDQLAPTDKVKVDFPTYAEYLAANANPHKVSDSFAFFNPATGFDRNQNPSTEITCTNCGAWGNKLDVEPEIKVVGPILSYPTVTPEKAIAAKREPETGNLPDIKTLQ